MPKAQDKVWINERTNHFYLRRGLARTPPHSELDIIKCGRGLYGGQTVFGLRSKAGQMVAFSEDVEDLYLFAIEHNYIIDDKKFYEVLRRFTQ
jgi:hypothetical protein